MGQEIEIRFAVAPGDLRRLARTLMLKGFASGKPSTRRLRSLYYDTPDLSLARAGLTLRVRKEGRAHIQTVKDESTGALLSERGEYESRLRAPEPDLVAVPDSGLREQMEALTAHAKLEAVLETDVTRITRALTTPAGDAIELAADTGAIRTLLNGHTVLDVSELELELKQGTPHALYEAARELSRASALTLALEIKSGRGLRALEGRGIATHKAGRARLPADGTAEDAFRATLLHCLHHIGCNTEAVASARDPEGVHQVRVGLRRLRAALSAFGPAFRVPTLEALRDRAKILADVFGDTRDFDVFERELLAPVEAVSHRAGMPELRLRLEALRHQSWDRTAALVRSDDFTGFLIDLASAVEDRVWRREASPETAEMFLAPARDMARESLDTALKKACKRARHLASLNAHQRHRLRIALKKLRYAAEFFAPLFGAKEVADFLRRLSKLQDLFGALNDAATAEILLGRALAAPIGEPQPDMAAAAAFIDGWHQSRVDATWDKAKTRWKRFAKTKPFWRG